MRSRLPRAVALVLAGAWPLSTPAAAADLAAIRSRGAIRYLVSAGDEERLLPRAGWLPDEARRAAAEFAEELGVSVEWVYVDDPDELVPALLRGEGDLIVDLLSVTPERSGQVAFSLPFFESQEVVVTRADDAELGAPRQLAGRRLAVQRGAPHWERARKLSERYRRLEIEEVSDDLGAHDLLAGVAAGRYDVTIADLELVRSFLAYRDDLRVAFELGERVPKAVAMPRESVNLRRALDSFLLRGGGTARAEAGPVSGDLPAIRERRILRVLTRNGPATYYIWKGQLVGFEYELVRAFAEEHKLYVELIVPPSRDDLIRWLREGRGDVVAAGLSASTERAAAEGVVFSAPYNEVREQVIGRAGEAELDGIDALAGRRVTVRRSSQYWRTLSRLREGGVAVELVAAPEEFETEELIARVASGEYDLTVADSHQVALQLAWREDVRVVLDLDSAQEHAWAVRPGNPELLAAIDAFLKKSVTLQRILARRYFESPKRMRYHGRAVVTQPGKLSPWDDPVRLYAKRFSFDWRLITAQMAQESGFDPKARSPVGAVGLMQLMPDTAAQMRVANWEQPEPNIHAGVKYMSWTRNRYDPTLDPVERGWFSLASYNAGIGHVADARRLAEEQGLDPNLWFGHVEEGMLLKCKPEFHRRTRYGYCRCWEPVQYVRQIRKRYEAYSKIISLESP
jgi:membrane-bound lytic murein transglycosylase F